MVGRHDRSGGTLKLALAGLAVACAAAGAQAGPPLRNPALLNIGLVCHWQAPCMKRQKRAMNKALGYVRKTKPPVWKIEQCNRNASRLRLRVDWTGFNNCIRNRTLERPRSAAKRRNGR